MGKFSDHYFMLGEDGYIKFADISSIIISKPNRTNLYRHMVTISSSSGHPLANIEMSSKDAQTDFVNKLVLALEAYYERRNQLS